eukprot:3873582-Prymnesium_polylepis.1
MARPAAGRHHGARAIPPPRARAHAISVRVARPTPRAAAAGVPAGPRVHAQLTKPVRTILWLRPT